MAKLQINDKSFKPSRLEADHARILATLPPLFQQTFEVDQAAPQVKIEYVITRNYATYSAYEEPLED